MSSIYRNPSQVRWVRKADGSLALQQLWEKIRAPEKGQPVVTNVWRYVEEPPLTEPPSQGGLQE